MNEPNQQLNVLVTRPKQQAEPLVRLIEQKGWHAIRFPTIEIIALDIAVVRQKIELINQYDWLIFISANAVNFVLSANDGKIDCFKGVSIAAVGKATAKALCSAGVTVDLMPESEFNTEGLLATVQMNDVTGKSCLIIRGKGGLERLANSLRSRNARVEYLEVYSRIKPVINDSTHLNGQEIENINVITITSVETLKNMLEMIAEKWHVKVLTIPIIVISNRIRKIAKEIGFKHIAVTDNPSDTAIIESVVKSLGKYAE